jgi:hypothetical protein
MEKVMAVETRQDPIWIGPDKWTKIIDKEEGFAFCDSGWARIAWSETEPLATFHGMNMPSTTQVNNPGDGVMWGRTDRYSNERIPVYVTVRA